MAQKTLEAGLTRLSFGPAAQVDAEDALIDARRSEAAGMHTIGIIPGSAVEVARMYVL
jgi:hypothetical protein